MSDTMDQILTNFEQQYEMYQRMRLLAEKQLLLLRQGLSMTADDRIHRILADRQELLISIMDLNKRNKVLQEHMMGELGLQRFVLSDLKQRLPVDQFSKLERKIADLGELLENINETDQENQRAMEFSTEALNGRPVEKTSSRQAQKAYRKIMEGQNRSS